MNESTSRYRRIRIRKPVVILSDADIEDLIETIRRQRASWKSVSRAASIGDQLVVTYTGNINGKVVTDSGAQAVTLVLRSDCKAERLHRSLSGARTGDRISVIIRHPKTDPNAALAGKQVSYEYHVQDVREKTLPVLDKSFVRSLGIASGSLSSLKKQLREILQQQIGTHVRRKVRQQLLDGLLEVHGDAIWRSRAANCWGMSSRSLRTTSSAGGLSTVSCGCAVIAAMLSFPMPNRSVQGTFRRCGERSDRRCNR